MRPATNFLRFEASRDAITGAGTQSPMRIVQRSTKLNVESPGHEYKELNATAFERSLRRLIKNYTSPE